MPKYLLEASYTAQGLKELQVHKASGRTAQFTKRVESLGGKVECVYFVLGDRDVIVIVDMPDHASVAALTTMSSASGHIRFTSTALMTVAEADLALAKASAG
jgi:uncharacterized protein with GYD domain